MKKYVNEQLIDMTAEEITARQTEEAQAAIDATARHTAEDVKKARIASAKTKLQDLGLTVDEVKDAFNI